jgi:AcrR family transcriptional regulator
MKPARSSDCLSSFAVRDERERLLAVFADSVAELGFAHVSLEDLAARHVASIREPDVAR